MVICRVTKYDRNVAIAGRFSWLFPEIDTGIILVILCALCYNHIEGLGGIYLMLHNHTKLLLKVLKISISLGSFCFFCILSQDVTDVWAATNPIQEKFSIMASANTPEVPQETAVPEPVDPGMETPVPVIETEVPSETEVPQETLSPTSEPVKTSAPKPFSVQLRQHNNKIRLSWKKVSGATSYQIYLKKPGKSFRKYRQTKKKKILLKYTPGKEYKIKVEAYGKKNTYLTTSQIYRFYIPKSTARINIVYQNNRVAKLSWKKVPRADYYLLYQKRGKGSAKLVKQTRKCEYTVRTLSSGNTYQFQVQAVYRQGKQKFIGKAAKRSYDNHQIVATNHQKYTYTEMASDIARLSAKYPNIVHYSVIGKSEDGRNIYDVTLGNRRASRSVLVVSTLHAREYMASLVCMSQIEYYARCYQEEIDGKRVSSVFSRTCIHYIPMANPDGVAISQYGISQIRNKKLRKKLKKLSKDTNTTVWKANAKGVDLNNNFPYQFQVRGTPGSQGYSGAKAVSSRETSAIVKRIKALKSTNLKAVINYHAMGSIIYGDSTSTASGSVIAGTARMYRTAQEITGYTSAGRGTSSSSGSLREYIMYDLHLPSITVEVGRHPCPGPISEFPRIWRENANLVLREAALFN